MPSNMIYKLTCVTETHIYHALYDSALARVMIVIAYHSIQHLTTCTTDHVTDGIRTHTLTLE